VVDLERVWCRERVCRVRAFVSSRSCRVFRLNIHSRPNQTRCGFFRRVLRRLSRQSTCASNPPVGCSKTSALAHFTQKEPPRGACRATRSRSYLDHAGAVVAHERGNLAFISHDACLGRGRGAGGGSSGKGRRFGLGTSARSESLNGVKQPEISAPETARGDPGVWCTRGNNREGAPFVRSEESHGSARDGCRSGVK